jgi:hypothetical protein
VAGTIERRGDGTTGPPTLATYGEESGLLGGKPARSAGRVASEHWVGAAASIAAMRGLSVDLY